MLFFKCSKNKKLVATDEDDELRVRWISVNVGNVVNHPELETDNLFPVPDRSPRH
jgi:hypothetical protein